MLSEDMVEVAVDIDDICHGCGSRDTKECGLCESRLQSRLEALDLGGRY
jgi:hypothetical protein